MDFLVQEVVNGVVLGCLYADVALGLTLIFGVLGVLNFAHGDVYTIGAYVGFGVLTLAGGIHPSIPLGILLILMFLAATIAGGLAGLAIERYAVRPLRNAPRIAPLLSTLGVSFFIENSLVILLGAQDRTYDTFNISGGVLFNTRLHVGPLILPEADMIVIGGTILLMVVLFWIVKRTWLGRAIRAVSDDRDAAAMMGANVNRIVMATFFIASALAGAGGVMLGVGYSTFNNLSGFSAGINGFTAAVIGGLGSIPGAVVGGIVVGLMQSLITGYVSSTFADVIVLSMLVIALILRPIGLFGRREVVKV